MRHRMIGRSQFLFSLIFMLAGAVLFTYASTRTWTTEKVLTRAKANVQSCLEGNGVYPSLRHPREDADPNAVVEFRKVLGCVTEAGGMYYWWNDAIPYWGWGAFLFAAGVVVIFYRSRQLLEGGEQSSAETSGDV